MEHGLVRKCREFDPGHGRKMKEWLALHPTSVSARIMPPMPMAALTSACAALA